MQMLFAAKYMAPGGKLGALLRALPLFEEAAGAMRELRRVAMKREAETLESATARATRAAKAMHAVLGDHARFKGRPFSEMIAEIADERGSPPPRRSAPATVDEAAAADSVNGSVQQPPLS